MLTRSLRKRTEGLGRITALNAALANDLALAMDLATPRLTPSTPFSILSFWLKCNARCLLAYVDGLSSALRRAVLDLAEDGQYEIVPKDRLRLAEKRLDKNGTVVDSFLKTSDSLKLGCKHFSAAWGADFLLDTGGEYWKALLSLVDARNAFTHPHHIGDLHPLTLASSLAPALQWFPTEMQRLVDSAGRSTGLQPRDLKKPPESFRYRSIPSTLFTDKDLELIREGPLKSFEYMKTALFMQLDEIRDALTLVSAESDKDSLVGPRGQFSLRNFLRTLFSAAEGIASTAEFYLTSTVERGEISLDTTELASIGVDPVSWTPHH